MDFLLELGELLKLLFGHGTFVLVRERDDTKGAVPVGRPLSVAQRFNIPAPQRAINAAW